MSFELSQKCYDAGHCFHLSTHLSLIALLRVLFIMINPNRLNTRSLNIKIIEIIFNLDYNIMSLNKFEKLHNL